MSEWNPFAASDELVKSLTRDGWNLSLPRYISHDIVVRSAEDAEALAGILMRADYTVEEVAHDPDYDCWRLTAREKDMVLISAETMKAAQARVEPLVLANGGRLNGVAVLSRDDEL